MNLESIVRQLKQSLRRTQTHIDAKDDGHIMYLCTPVKLPIKKICNELKYIHVERF